MALRVVAPLLALVVGAFAGCLGAGDAGDVGAALDGPVRLVPAETPLWAVQQYVPHPAYNFPTLTNPATGANVPEWWAPIEAAPLPDPITGLSLFSASPEGVPQGAGMAVFGSLAVVPGYGEESYVVDIRDPANPVRLANFSEPEEFPTGHRNVDFIAYPNGTLVAVFAAAGNRLPVWDLTDPTHPVEISNMTPKAGTHKVNVVPGTPIVYNANSWGQEGGELCCMTEIYDLSDPWNPVLVQEWKNGYGCHHIYFWNNPAEDKYRAICAGIEATQLWDTADPLHPEVLVDIPVHHGNDDLPSMSVWSNPGIPLGIFMFSHFGILNDDGTVLIVGDEMGGGGVPPGCGVGASAASRSASTPLGALWFYDVRDETNPVLKGFYSPGGPWATNTPAVGTEYVDPTDPTGTVFGTVFGNAFSCTAHHGRLVPDPERDLLAMAFYWAGTVLVDFTDPASPFMVDQFNEGADTWEVQYYNGYLFTGDLRRGMDVLALE